MTQQEQEEQTFYLQLTDYLALKIAYEDAVKLDKSEFVFKGNIVKTNYIKYLLETMRKWNKEHEELK
jgi:hypothetical protein